jgi:hypothetical protein
MYEQPKKLSNRALEMIMRDVLDGMQDLALGAALRSGHRGCHILSIGPASLREARDAGAGHAAEVVDLGRYRRVVGG